MPIDTPPETGDAPESKASVARSWIGAGDSEDLLTLEGVTKCFGGHAAIEDIDLVVGRGEIVALLGPSGCGKTTTLRCIAGFERADKGSVTIGGRVVEGPSRHVPPEERRIGVVFQDYALFPHLDVTDNVAFGLDGRRRRRRKAGRVEELLELVGLSGLGDRMPNELSGGQQQRVALARALAPDPDLVLLDEPFSNLDSTLRQRVRAEVQQILHAAHATAVFVTHAQEEALSMADRVAVMRDGHIKQVAPPDELYRSPASPFVSAFLADATLVDAPRKGGTVVTPWGPAALPAGSVRAEHVLVAIRPETVSVRRASQSSCKVVDREFYGHDEVVTIVGTDGHTLRARVDNTVLYDIGTPVEVTLRLGIGDVFDAVRHKE